jgi:hypothetical protein
MSEKFTPVPKADTDRLKKAIRERVIKPIQDRSKRRHELEDAARRRHVMSPGCWCEPRMDDEEETPSPTGTAVDQLKKE